MSLKSMKGNADSHINEPDCAVKQALAEKLIGESRYQSYKKMYEELSERRKY